MTDNQSPNSLDSLEREIVASLRRAAYGRSELRDEVLPFLSDRTIDAEIKAGRLRAVKCGGRTAVLAIDAARFLAALRRADEATDAAEPKIVSAAREAQRRASNIGKTEEEQCAA